MQYRSKELVEAVKWNVETIEDGEGPRGFALAAGEPEWPDWFTEALHLEDGGITVTFSPDGSPVAAVQGAHGTVFAAVGDYILSRGGRFDVLNGNLFEAAYERVIA